MKDQSFRGISFTVGDATIPIFPNYNPPAETPIVRPKFTVVTDRETYERLLKLKNGELKLTLKNGMQYTLTNAVVSESHIVTPDGIQFDIEHNFAE